MTNHKVETRMVCLETRARRSRFDRLSRNEIMAEASSRYRRLLRRYGGHNAMVAALSQMNQGAAQRLDALHQAGELQP